MTNHPETTHPDAPAVVLIDALVSAPTLSPQQWQSISPFVRWLVMTRSVVFVMTLGSAGIGIALAYQMVEPNISHVLVLLVGLVLAHATNNLINDWVDYTKGTDDNNYFRRRYGVHVLAQGLVSQRQFIAVTLATASAALACGMCLIWQQGIELLPLVASGVFFVLFYTWPLKQLALGEVAVFLVWGPFMVAGTCFTLAGSVSPEAWLVSMMAGIGATLVIMGKHLDKLSDDLERRQRSLPTVLGEPGTRRALAALVGVLGILATVAVIVFGPRFLVLALSLPAAFGLTRCLTKPAPTDRPQNFPASVWPLWFTAQGFRFNRSFSLALLVTVCLAN